jgi:hypothetical protein
LIELTDDAVTGGSRQTDCGDQRRHADHDAGTVSAMRRTRSPGAGLETSHQIPDAAIRALDGGGNAVSLPPKSRPSFMLTGASPGGDAFVATTTSSALLVELGEEIQIDRCS